MADKLADKYDPLSLLRAMGKFGDCPRIGEGLRLGPFTNSDFCGDCPRRGLGEASWTKKQSAFFADSFFGNSGTVPA